MPNYFLTAASIHQLRGSRQRHSSPTWLPKHPARDSMCCPDRHKGKQACQLTLSLVGFTRQTLLNNLSHRRPFREPGHEPIKKELAACSFNIHCGPRYTSGNQRCSTNMCPTLDQIPKDGIDTEGVNCFCQRKALYCCICELLCKREHQAVSTSSAQSSSKAHQVWPYTLHCKFYKRPGTIICCAREEPSS